MRKLIANWRWIVPLLLYSADAHAWGLYTHVYFAQHLIWAIPLTDPRYYRAVRDFPGLVLAGACLPDLALVGKHFGLHGISDSHNWENPHDLLRNANGGAETAIAVGYASHLWVDIIAHNHFVPAHETMWPNIPMATHAAAEWAMDHYLSSHLYGRPDALLRTHARDLVPYVARHFKCEEKQAHRAIAGLAAAESVLRGSGLPRMLFEAARAMDRGLQRRFNYYLSETADRLRNINRMLEGETPGWLADPPGPQALHPRIAGISRLALRHRIPLPQDFFAPVEG